MKVRLSNSLWLVCLLISTTQLLGQEQLIGYSFHNAHGKRLNSRNEDTLCLPVIDQFYLGKGEVTKFPSCNRELYQSNKFYPTQFIWEHNGVTISDEFSDELVNLGAAIFDGADSLNQARIQSPNSYGPSDTLTSNAINLEPYIEADSVYLTIHLGYTGFGNLPENVDSFKLEFKDQSGIWGNHFSIVPDDIDPVEVIYIPIVDSLLYNGFQFRCSNYATLSGINDHWFIDQIVLDVNQSVLNPLADVAYSSVTQSFNGMYSAPLSIISDVFSNPDYTFEAIAFNQSGSVQNVNYQFELSENCGNTQLETGNISSYLIDPSNTQIVSDQITNSNVQTFLSSGTCSDPAINLTIIQDQVDNFNWNDTIVQTIQVSKEIQFDDGSAEAAYGVTGNGTKQAAVRFPTPLNDTLYGLKVHFAQQNVFPIAQDFSFMVWESISHNGGVDNLIGRRDFSKVQYIDSANGFATYLFNNPIVLPATDSFYLGWFQLKNETLNFGFDRNTDHSEEIFFYSSSVWRKTGFEGAVMLRPLFDGESVGTSTQNIGKQQKQILQNQSGFSVEINQEYDWKVYSIDGKLISTETSSVFKPYLTKGVYIVTAVNKISSVLYTRKIVVL